MWVSNVGAPRWRRWLIGAGVASALAWACAERSASETDDGDNEVGAGGEDGTVPPGSPTCGDGVVDDGERCDDRNPRAGDGCSAECRVETGWRCDGSEPTICDETCGDGTLVGAEANAGGCDDGNTEDDDGCSATCRVEIGYFCSGAPSVCTKSCGNGLLDGEEACDDANSAPGDGCFACAEEPEWVCTGAPSVCTHRNACQGEPCRNGGACTAGIDGFTCDCSGTGFTGPTCETSTDDCNPDPCENGGVCIDGDGASTCQCDGTGYEGPRCETNVDDCSPNPCQHGGACSDLLNGYACDCSGTGYYGNACELDAVDCNPNPCRHAGVCMEGSGMITCDCTGTGYEGTSCQDNVDDCSPNPCQHGGDCTDGVNDFSCDCSLTGYRGDRCQTNVDDCAPNPCQNGGTCVDGLDAHTCRCPSGFTGNDCQTNVNDCAGNPCQNGGSCIDGVSTYTCDCNGTGFTGMNCEVPVDACTPNPCMNGGVCTREPFSCDCSGTGYTGSYCETEVGWTRQFGTNSTDSANSVALDVNGNVFVGGSTTGTFGQFDGERSDAFVAKYSGTGTLRWIRQMGSNGGDYARGVSVDPSGNVYVAGDTDDHFPSWIPAGAVDAFIEKYDASGTLLWTRQYGLSGSEYVNGVSVDSSGNAFVVGSTDGRFPGQSSAGAYDAFLVKFNDAGAPQWVRQLGSRYLDAGYAVSVDSSGNAFIAGYVMDTLSGQSSAGSYDAFVAKYNTSGSVQWIRQFGTDSVDYGRSVCVDSSGNAYVAGYTFGAFPGQSNAGNEDVFVAKYDGSGTLQWTGQFGTAGSDYGLGVSVDATGNVYVAGYTMSTFSGQARSGGQDAFVAKYDGSGTLRWVRQFGTGESDAAYGVVGVDSNGFAYVTGETGATLPGQTSAGSTDAFLKQVAP